MADDPRSALIAQARRIGADPLDLATAISYETGGTFNPSIRGGAGNRHIGLIQFGPAEQKAYGASQGQSFQEQLPAVGDYLQARGFRPGMGMLDLYSTINAGSPGRYGASDAGNGGAPGTVADKVNGQMASHRAKAAAFLGGDFAPVMPGATTRSGAFGLSGPVASDAPAAQKVMPETPDTGIGAADILRLLQVAPTGAPSQQPAQQPVAPRPTQQQPAPRFDPSAFYALLNGRVR